MNYVHDLLFTMSCRILMSVNFPIIFGYASLALEGEAIAPMSVKKNKT